ncbi:hypothetical protein [Anabaena sp. PCC 7108]|uniref:hypothetical protein n=1 Tax=Anabaena sp. PCC 7108 TaxID=163908 RepID=UPI00034C5ED3|nr:hypothetical protein [Anabaena sp. PCC 7108]
MTDPITAITASAIANLAFQEFIKSGSGELAKKFTTDAIAKMNELRKTILNKLRGKSLKVDEALTKAEKGDSTALPTITKYLDVVMEEDSDFAEQIKNIAHQINIGKIQDNSSMTQNNSDNARGWQTKVEGGTAYIGEIHINEKKDS